MKMRIELTIENESGAATTTQIAALERQGSDDLIGISLEEAKSMTGSVQPPSSKAKRGKRSVLLLRVRTAGVLCAGMARTG